MKKQPVADWDNDKGKYQASWLWQCEFCGEQTIEQAGEIPQGWEVEDEDDLENTPAACAECVEEFGGDEPDDSPEWNEPPDMVD